MIGRNQARTRADRLRRYKDYAELLQYLAICVALIGVMFNDVIHLPDHLVDQDAPREPDAVYRSPW